MLNEVLAFCFNSVLACNLMLDNSLASNLVRLGHGPLLKDFPIFYFYLTHATGVPLHSA